MSITILDYEKQYSQNLIKIADDLENLSSKILGKEISPFQTQPFTESILLRMKYYYLGQYKIKDFLGKKYVNTAADIFEEAVIFYLKMFLELSNNKNLVISSEQTIKLNDGKSIRPDISIWKDDTLHAVIECKTQLGWNRKGWEDDFVKREQRLKNTYPNIKMFLLVMTSENWSGFHGNDKAGIKYFTLANKWPKDVDENNLSNIIINNIETLFNKIVS
jgi:hypothetical protein